jgi:phosphoribosylformimino-5-aminoimidazole carboxamide ribotide isomerase
VARGYRTLAPFPTVYVADLDAIEGRGSNLDTVARLVRDIPGLTVWLDNGAATPEAAEQALAVDGVVLVVGSESQTDSSLLARLVKHRPDRIVLSLDFRDGFVGPPVLLQDPSLWPDRIIAMTLGRVGSGAGPDLDRMASLRAARPGLRVYAAGGVRTADDLLAARGAGAAGALIATALHRGAINAADLAAVMPSGS